ncbi:MAG: DUF4386 family protein [Gammaproteobacteria bacterium]
MDASKSAARWIAVLLITQMVVGSFANFGLLEAPFRNPPGFLVSAAPHAFNVALSAVLIMALGAVAAGLAVAAWPVVRPRSERLALSLAVLGTAAMALATVESAGLMSLLSLSQAYTATAAPDETLYQALRGVVAAHRNWAHYTHLIVDGALLLALYATLFRLALVPRAIAGLGAAASLLQMTTIGMTLFGRPVVFGLLLPLAAAHLLLIGWLLFKGFREGPELSRS